MSLPLQKRVKKIVSKIRHKNEKIVIWEIDKINKNAINMFRMSGLEPDAILSFGAGCLLKKAWGINVFHPDAYLWGNRDKIILCISKYEYNLHKNFLLFHLGLDRKRIFVDYKKDWRIITWISFIWKKTIRVFFYSKDQFMYLFSIIGDLQRLWSGFFVYKKVCHHLNKEDFVFFFNYTNAGEIYLSSSFLKRYLENRSLNDYLVVVSGEKSREIVEMFGFEHIFVIPISKSEDLSWFISAIGEDRLGIKRIGMPGSYLDISIKLAAKILNITDYYTYKIFGYDEKPKLEYPVNCIEPDDFCFDLFKKSGLIKGKTIILSPYSESEISAGYLFWKRVIQYYLKNGYVIVTLKSGEEESLPYTKSLNVPLKYLNVCVEYAGYFIGVRNEICDLIVNAECKKVIFYFENIYGSHYRPYKETMSSTAYSWASFSENGLSDTFLEIRNQYHFNVRTMEIINNFFRSK